mmetsp:Transcript_22625/g.22383  ORF Transcript_22625/g.22383 Transcript_22625/m.22383 type:complete len:205 (+) Transcript_22625:108-722(+)
MEINDHLGGSSTTIQHGIRYFDSFLSVKPVSHVRILQLVGIVALGVALKYEFGRELSPRRIFDLCSGNFPIEAIVTTEVYMLNVLGWRLDVPTASEISRCLLSWTCGAFDFSTLAKYSDSYAAVCYLDSTLFFEPPLLIAVASICCALDKFKYQDFKKDWLQMVKQDYPYDVMALDSVLERIQIKIVDISASSEDQSTRSGSPL